MSSILAIHPVPDQRRADRIGTVDIRAAAANTHAELASMVSSTTQPATYVSTSAVCPAWCKGHLEDISDGPVLHTSAWRDVTATSGPEMNTMSASIERLDVAGEPLDVAGIRLGGSGAMTAAEALQLAAALQQMAFVALLDNRPAAADTRAWAAGILAQSARQLGDRYGMSLDDATRLRLVVEDLLGQAEGDK